MATEKTDAKILEAFSQLVLKFGYKGTTTRKIAEAAGVNESTIFRHFKDKHAMLETLVNRYLQDIDQVAENFQAQGAISLDLMWVAEVYYQFVQAHQAVFLLGLREAYQFPEIAAAVKQLPLTLKTLIYHNFQKMVATGEIKASVDLEAETDNFVLMNFANAVFTYAYPDTGLNVALPSFLKRNIQAFASHLTDANQNKTD